MSGLLFFDTEWATDAGRELVSLALVNADGSRCFYAERDPLPAVASTFVQHTVYPLLERGEVALPDRLFTERLRAFVTVCDNPRIHFDALLDKVLLGQAMSEWGRNLKGVPAFVPVFVERNDVRDEVGLYFQNNPEALARRHHAGVDAEALRYAFVLAVDP